MSKLLEMEANGCTLTITDLGCTIELQTDSVWGDASLTPEQALRVASELRAWALPKVKAGAK